jgi:hypothetical protein
MTLVHLKHPLMCCSCHNSLQTATKQAKKQKEAKSKQNKQQKSTSSTKTDRKGKGRAEEVVDEEEQDHESYDLVDEEATANAEEDPQPKKLAKRHRVFNDEDNADDNEAATSSTAPRLDPALFQQAEAAFEDAKRRALQEQRAQKQIMNEARSDNAPSRSRKRSRKQSSSHGTAIKVIG